MTQASEPPGTSPTTNFFSKVTAKHKKILRNFLLEIIVFGVLVTFYYFLVIRYLSEPLENLFNTNLVPYAIMALILIVVQGFVLEIITSFLLSKLGLGHTE